jgi:DNA-binding transcriptional ArsR family regulator
MRPESCHAKVKHFDYYRIMETNDVVRALAALAQASRLDIFRALVQAGPAGLTPGELSTHLDVAGNTLSFHLKELMHADLVSQERAGRNLIYRARFDRMQQVLSYLSDNCCQGGVCEVDSTRANALCPTP